MVFSCMCVYLSRHEDPTSLGQDVFPLKLHGEFFQFIPSMLHFVFSPVERLYSFHLFDILACCYQLFIFFLEACDNT